MIVGDDARLVLLKRVSTVKIDGECAIGSNFPVDELIVATDHARLVVRGHNVLGVGEIKPSGEFAELTVAPERGSRAATLLSAKKITNITLACEDEIDVAITERASDVKLRGAVRLSVMGAHVERLSSLDEGGRLRSGRGTVVTELEGVWRLSATNEAHLHGSSHGFEIRKLEKDGYSQ